MKEFEPVVFEPAVCKRELEELKNLLNENRELKEKDDILPFFRARKNLSVFTGSYVPDIVNFDMIAYEYSIYGDFSSDLVIGDSQTKTFCFVEFEDATDASIFRKQAKKVTPEWSPRFEHGFSQIVDWFWKLDDMSRSTDFKSKFGANYVKYYGLLIIGRSKGLEYREQQRLKWRIDKVLVDSKHIFCVTFDDLCSDIEARLKIYPDMYLSDKQTVI
ncbi:MAG: DUF4263 domain-containing protein [Desulfobacterales bacterium]|nr:DUF4263 domain-containing protein [Desulfobacterales bacterium]